MDNEFNKVDLKRKLSSRKFWAAILSFVGTMCVALGFSDMSTERVVAVISSFSVLIIYIVGETIVDKNRTTTVEPVFINWKQKLSSRKFWAALLGFVSTLIVSLGCSEMTAERVGAIITAVATLSVYILGESAVDSSNTTNTPPTIGDNALDDAFDKVDKIEDTFIGTPVVPEEPKE